jgi:hypothetical protein
MVKDNAEGRNDDERSRADDAVPQPRVSGPKSCLFAIGISLVLGLGSMALSKLMFEKRNASVLAASDVLGRELTLAEARPGVAELLADGCEAAGALTPTAIGSVAQQLENEDARKKGVAPREIALGDEVIVFCARGGEPLSCAALAKRYAAAAAPTQAFVVTSRTRTGEACAERFAPDAAPLGSAPSPNLPLLLPPK